MALRETDISRNGDDGIPETSCSLSSMAWTHVA
jgi:hypothetical protein